MSSTPTPTPPPPLTGERAKRRKITKSSASAAHALSRRDNDESPAVSTNENRLGELIQEERDEEPTQDPVGQKPVWMSEADWAQRSSHMNLSGEPRLKKRKQRLNVNEQRERAEQIRQRQEEREKSHNEPTRNAPPDGNADHVIRNHYNQRTHFSRKQKRSESKIYRLRNFNNAIKYMLINKFAVRGGKVLDLGCGKGGDLNKWNTGQVGQYIGIDLSDESIKEAIRRFQYLSSPTFQVVFTAGDGFGTPIPDLLQNFPEVEFPLDTVSMQFCMHYGFESEEKVRIMLTNISKSLRPGGYFLGTIPSSDYIRDHIKKLPPGERKWGNSIFSVTFQDDPPRDGIFRPPYGHVYNYFLQDAVENVPEYVVPFEAFRALAEEFSLELRYKKTFTEVFMEEIPTWVKKLSPRLLNGMRRSDGSYGLEGEEKEAMQLYMAFAFEKTI